MLFRQLGSIVRGSAAPFQLVSACVLGAMIGFAPGLREAPALYALLAAALLVVNANIGLALLVAAGAKIVGLLLLPVSFQVGRFLLDGPAEPLARVVVNAPVFAWCGLERYAVAGGQLLAVVLGLVVGFALARAVTGFRRKMAARADDPSRLTELGGRRWARFMLWLLFGGKGKKSWNEKLETRGRKFRVAGVATLVVLGAGLWLGHRALVDSLAESGLRSGLEGASGATVDVGAVEVDLGEARIAVAGLAMADPGALERDLLRADALEVDVDEADVLRRRVHLKRVVVSEAASGAPRETPGVLLAPPPAPPAEPEPPSAEGEWRLEDVLADVEMWEERLQRGRRWLDALSGEPDPEADGPGLEERIERQAREEGWFSVAAGHLVSDAPTFLLSELVVDGLAVEGVGDRVFDLVGANLTSHPRLVDGAPRVELTSRDGAVNLVADLAPLSAGGGDGQLALRWTGLSVDAAMAQLSLDEPPFSGGTLDLELDGSWLDGRVGWIDLPLRATLRGTTVSVGGMQPQQLDELVLPIGLVGPIERPRVRFDTAALQEALVASGKAELASQLGGALDGELGELGEKLGLDEGLEEQLSEGTKGLLQGVLGGSKGQDQPR
jgi:uncharacterized protein (TIGR03546 family)